MITYAKVLLFELKEQARVRRLFYKNRTFERADRALIKAYRGVNPYRICKEYLKERGAECLYAYGETPLTTMGKIAKRFHINSDDRVIEMGAGRGRVALFLAEYVGCRVLAFEQVPLFCKRMISSKNLKVVSGDMFSAPFDLATVVFLYGTMLSEEQIIALPMLVVSKVLTI